MQDDIDMEPLHKLFIYRKKLVKPYIERLLKWMDGITYMMSALFILTLVYEHGFLISFEENGDDKHAVSFCLDCFSG